MDAGDPEQEIYTPAITSNNENQPNWYKNRKKWLTFLSYFNKAAGWLVRTNYSIYNKCYK